MSTKGLVHASQTARDHAARIAARKVDPEPVPIEPADPNAAFLELFNRYNTAAMEAYRLEGEIVTATLKRKGDRIRIGEGGQLLHQVIGNPVDFEAARRPKILIIECLGTEV